MTPAADNAVRAGAGRAAGATLYVRYAQAGGAAAYGILEGDVVHELADAPFDGVRRTGATQRLDAVRLLPPAAAQKVIAVGLNYRSHLGDRRQPETPGIFTKFPTSLLPHEGVITYFDGVTDLHYEGEMVLVIGRTACNVSEAAAPEHIFAVAPGNDVSERVWQRSDLQWFRAKSCDTFAPVGPVMAAGVGYDDLLLQTRLNGTVVQSQRTSDLIFGTATIVSFVSRYVTLEPGDMIFTGTPGTTRAMQPGDVVEVDLEGVGVLRNTVGRKGARPAP